MAPAQVPGSTSTILNVTTQGYTPTHVPTTPPDTAEPAAIKHHGVHTPATITARRIMAHRGHLHGRMTREHRFRMYNSRGPPLQQIADPKPARGSPYIQPNSLEPREAGLEHAASSDADWEEVKPDNRAGVPREESTEGPPRPRHASSHHTKATDSTSEQGLGTKHKNSTKLDTLRASDHRLILHNGTSIRIPEIELPFKRILPATPRLHTGFEPIPAPAPALSTQAADDNLHVFISTAVPGRPTTTEHGVDWSKIKVLVLLLLGFCVVAGALSYIRHAAAKRLIKAQAEKGEGRKGFFVIDGVAVS
ncbi:hypothetical protein JHW43_002833 [Diplocarpon mali]|nr:hypothetical protein JHW43_002833 [Diplocarpon mali]